MKMTKATEVLVHQEKELPGDIEFPGRVNTGQQNERLPEEVGIMGATTYAARGDTIGTMRIRTVQVPTIGHQTQSAGHCRPSQDEGCHIRLHAVQKERVTQKGTARDACVDLTLMSSKCWTIRTLGIFALDGQRNRQT